MKHGALQQAVAGAAPGVPSMSVVVERAVKPAAGTSSAPAKQSDPERPERTGGKGEQLAYSMTDVARILGIHQRTLKRDIDRCGSAFPAPLRVGRGERRYVLAEVIEFYRRREVSK